LSDARHHGMLTLLQVAAATRQFGHWSLSFRDLDAPSATHVPTAGDARKRFNGEANAYALMKKMAEIKKIVTPLGVRWVYAGFSMIAGWLADRFYKGRLLASGCGHGACPDTTCCD